MDKYDQDSIEISGDVYNVDFDEAGWEPEPIKDGDNEMSEKFGY